jgi:hypothetical protein
MIYVLRFITYKFVSTEWITNNSEVEVEKIV